jgi:hypothetical protein
MNEKEFNKIVAEAKKAEYEHSTGEKIDTTKELNLDTLDELDFE